MQLSISKAEQIAALLNERNQLIIKYDADRILKDSDSYVFIEDENKVIGCAEIKKVQWYQWELSHVSVKKDGNGWGRRIIQNAEKLAISNGAKIIQCTIRHGNERSITLFEKNGYTKCNSFYYPQSGNQVLIYQKSLFDMEIVYHHFEQYVNGASTSNFNIPHRYKLAQLGGLNTTKDLRTLWERVAVKAVTKNLLSKLKDHYQEKDFFYVCSPPTGKDRKELFLDPLYVAIKREFINSIDIHFFLSKKDESLNAATTDSYIAVKQNIKIDSDSFDDSHNQTVNKLLILDDVFASGKSVNALIDILNSRLKISECLVVTLIKT